jgi:hypothetical protein
MRECPSELVGETRDVRGAGLEAVGHVDDEDDP